MFGNDITQERFLKVAKKNLHKKADAYYIVYSLVLFKNSTRTYYAYMKHKWYTFGCTCDV